MDYRPALADRIECQCGLCLPILAMESAAGDSVCNKRDKCLSCTVKITGEIIDNAYLGYGILVPRE